MTDMFDKIDRFLAFYVAKEHHLGARVSLLSILGDAEEHGANNALHAVQRSFN